MYPKRIVKKIPGDIPPPTKKENQGHIDDLANKPKIELEELLDRQNKILANRKFISMLPDKGEKIIAFRDKLLNILNNQKEIDKAAVLLSRLNIASEGKAAMNELEWTGSYSEEIHKNKIIELDSDDEEDPLKILAQPTGTGVHKKKVIHLQPVESLIKPEDIEEIESFKNGTSPEPIHVKYVIDKVEKSQEKNLLKREPFKPYKTSKSNVHDPEKEKERKYTKYWEITAATPPHIVHGAIKPLSLNESLQLQREHVKKLQEMQAKHAAERLAQQLGLHNVGYIPENVGDYRIHKAIKDDSSSSSESEEDEVHDDEDNDKGGTIVYTIDSIKS
ncbi:DNA-directed RNA polymerase II subunit GRINL1A [Vespa velutina]|uniref:DNA-directed RNA polymerase II subunit GRINL1A n=1 Tax=Vespa velutina TaxID=202808 RepID=UPI001FB274C8|nr:DNA-directed RNA polymerase II subunit GRINL1A [Vespa velutina]